MVENIKKSKKNENNESAENKKKRLVTAALPYINNIPHLGHIVGCHLPADIFVRFSRARGYDALFIGGTDENGSTSELAAESTGVDINEFSDKLFEQHKKIYDWFDFSYDNFSRTSKEIHHKTAKEYFLKAYKNGYIQKGKMNVFYSPEEDRYLPDRYVKGTCPECGYKEANGDQCEKCTAVLDASKLISPKSVITGNSVESRETEHLFLKLDLLSDKLQGWISKQKEWRSQVKSLAQSWIDKGLKPRSVTRDLKHGVKVPLEGFQDKVLYVWFDAPIGYVSSTRELREDWEELWKGDTEIFNFIGKDNIPFHTIFWPAICMAEGSTSLAKDVVGLQYLNYEGGKFSKSKKRGVFCEKLPDSGIEADLWRGYLTKVIPETNDSEFKWENFQNTINSELLGNYGNFLNRTLGFIKNNFKEGLEKPDNKEFTKEDKKFIKTIGEKFTSVTNYLERRELRNSFNEILSLSSIGNKYFNDSQPWEIIKQDRKRANNILYLCLHLNKILAVLFAPFIPSKSREAWRQLNFSGSPDLNGIWNESLLKFDIKNKHEISRPKHLFRRLGDEELKKVKKIVSETKELKDFFSSGKKNKYGKKNDKSFKSEKPSEIVMGVGNVSFKDWKNLDLRVATVKSVEDIEGADKLYKINLSVGEEIGERVVCAGLKPFYTKEDLKGKKVVYFSNLEPKKFKGVESKGMVLAASTNDHERVILITPESDIPEGSQIS